MAPVPDDRCESSTGVMIIHREKQKM